MFQCFNPRARDGREKTAAGIVTNMMGFNPRARDGREMIAYDNK